MSESVTTATETSSTPGRPRVVLGVVALDTDEPTRLADFYAALLGWQVERTDDDWVQIGPSGDAPASGTKLAFQLVPEFKAPTWPTQDVPQQVHLDLDVPDLDEGERFALSLGARRVQPAELDPSFRVFLDPSGHPFCLCQGS
jgi:predicted enzyme related to lactoylglutathione lyase